MKLSRYALGLVATTFLLLLAGGLVHNTRSSLACPDWPLCFGSAFPKMEGGVLIEHGHRLLATSVGLGTIGLLIALIHRARRTGERGLIGLGVLALGLVVTQGVLGGLTVIYRLPTLVSTAHLATSMIFFSLLICISLRLRPASTHAAAPRLTRASAIAAGGVYVQMLLGALMRHLGAGLACTDLPLCRGAIWPSGEHPNVLLHATHRLAAIAVLAVTAWLAVLVWRGTTERTPRLLALAAPLLTLVQAALGIFSITTFLDVLPVTAHLGVAALLLADLVTLHLLSRGPLGAQASLPRAAASVSFDQPVAA